MSNSSVLPASGLPLLLQVELTVRRHVDLVRVASAICLAG